MQYAIADTTHAGLLPASQLSWKAWTPTRTSWTDVGGAPTVTARYCTIGNMTFFQIKVVPVVSIAIVGGTSYVDLPVAPGASALAGEAILQDLTTLLAIGDCVMDLGNAKCYPPTKTATGDTLLIAGNYES